jgi:hypothetical protein
MDVGMMMVFASYGWENCTDRRVWDGRRGARVHAGGKLGDARQDPARDLGTPGVDWRFRTQRRVSLRWHALGGLGTGDQAVGHGGPTGAEIVAAGWGWQGGRLKPGTKRGMGHDRKSFDWRHQPCSPAADAHILVVAASFYVSQSVQYERTPS